MRHLIQEACQGPVRCAVAEHGAAVSKLCDADLRPVSPVLSRDTAGGRRLRVKHLRAAAAAALPAQRRVVST